MPGAHTAQDAILFVNDDGVIGAYAPLAYRTLECRTGRIATRALTLREFFKVFFVVFQGVSFLRKRGSAYTASRIKKAGVATRDVRHPHIGRS